MQVRGAFLVIVCLVWHGAAVGAELDLTKAAIVVNGDGVTLDKAADFIHDEVAARTGVSWKTAASRGHGPAIVLSVQGDAWSVGGVTLPDNPEAYAVVVDGDTVQLAGRSPRAAVFAAGHLLRALDMEGGTVSIDDGYRVATAPAYPVRGHQIGYRNTANAYDAWDVATYEQYIRDLLLFGTNAVELIPSLDPTEKDGPVMERTMWEMTADLSKLLADYDMDVWLWLALDGDVTDRAVAEKELEARRALFKSCVRIDDIFVPGGDPGDTEPQVLMPWLARMADVLHEVHPDAGVWVSNQGFTEEQNAEFFDYIAKEKPQWLAGVVFGPWAKISLPEMRERTPAEYPVRRYPDITHCLRCQYPMPQWDPAFAHTLGREPNNPRPDAMRLIHNRFEEYANGFVTYSDGINDDVNKMLWSALGWDPEVDIDQVLHDYARMFIGARWENEAALGLRGFEKSWQGAASANAAIGENLARWQKIEKEMGDGVRKNWRMQMHLLRAYYDAYVQARLHLAQAKEAETLALLAKATPQDVDRALAAADETIKPSAYEGDIAAWRARIDELGAWLHETIGMQLDVARYKARNSERGAVLEFLDQPLNNQRWLEAELARVAALPTADEKVAAARAIAAWESPVPGTIYDDLGNGRKQPHLVRQLPYEEDPGFVASPQEEFSKEGEQPARLSWLDQAQTLFGTPLKMHYDGLDPNAAYTLRVTYAGRFRATMKLTADGTHVVHDALAQPDPIAPVDFELPQALTADGALDLQWDLVDGRGCQVAEVWLIPNKTR